MKISCTDELAHVKEKVTSELSYSACDAAEACAYCWEQRSLKEGNYPLKMLYNVGKQVT